jgi:hypothetical protein
MLKNLYTNSFWQEKVLVGRQLQKSSWIRNTVRATCGIKSDQRTRTIYVNSSSGQRRSPTRKYEDYSVHQHLQLN